MAEPFELQGLYTRITMDADSFTQGVNAVQQQMTRLQTNVIEGTAAVARAFKGMAATVAGTMGQLNTAIAGTTAAMGGLVKLSEGVASVGAAAGQVEGMVTALGKLKAAERKQIEQIAAALTSVGTALGPLENVSATLGGLREGIVNISKAGPSLKNAAEKLTGLGAALDSIKSGVEPMARAATELTNLATAFGNLTPLVKDIGLLRTNIRELGQSFHGFANAASVMDGSQATVREFARTLRMLSRGGEGIPPMVAALERMVNVLPTVEPAAKALANVGRFVEGMSSANVAKFAPVTAQISQFADDFAKIVPRLMVAGSAEAATALGRIGNFVRSFSAFKFDADKVANLSATITTMFNAVAEGLKVVPDISPASLFVSRLSGFMNALTRVNTSKLDDVKSAISGLFGVLGTETKNMADMAGVSLMLSRVTSNINALSGADPGKMTATLGPMRDLTAVLGDIAKVPDMRGVSLVFGRLTGYLAMLKDIDPTKLPALVQPLREFFEGIMQLDPARVAAAQGILKSVSNIGLAMNRMAKVDTAKMLANVTALRTVASIINSVTLTENAEKMSMVMQRIGNAMSGMGGGGGGGPMAPGGLGGWFNNAARSGSNFVSVLDMIPSAATRSSTTVAGLTQAFRSLYIMSGAVQMSLYGFRLSLLGIGILGVTQFARLDDLLRRSMANMRDWAMESREFLQSGLFGISSAGPIGATDLAKGLDILTSSGYNAAAAMKALGVANEYAVASGTKVDRGVESLLEIMSGMNKFSTIPEENYAMMKRISDLLVGVAAKVPATQPDDLARAFTGKFMTSARQLNMSLEEAMTLVATYATVGGKSFKGSSAGNFISRALNDILKQATAGGKTGTVTNDAWRQLLGQDVFSEQGKVMMPVIDLLGLMSRKMAGMGTATREAQLLALGFEQTSLSVIQPLLDNASALAGMRDEIAKMGGITEKTAELMRGSLVAQLRQLWNAASNAANVFASYLAPVLYGVSRAIIDAADAFTKLNPAFQNLIVLGSVAVGLFFILPPVLMAIADLVLSIALAPFALMASGVMLVVEGFIMMGSVAATAVDLLVKGVSGLVTGLTEAGKLAVALAGDLVAAFRLPMTALVGFMHAMSSGFMFVIDTLHMVADGILFVQKNFTAVTTAITTAAVKMLTLVAVEFAAFVLTAIAWMALLGPILSLVAGIAAFVAAGFATVGITIANLAVMVGTTLVNAWDSFKVSAANAASVAVSGVRRLNDSIVNMWENFKEGAGETLADIAKGLRDLAGFFWNFAHNARVIMATIKQNGEVVFRDLTKAILLSIEIMVGNAATILWGIGRAVVSIFTTAWNTVQRYVGVVFDWIGNNWKTITSDMGKVSGSFIRNFMENFSRIFKVLGAEFELFIFKATKTLHRPLSLMGMKGPRLLPRVFGKTGEEVDLERIAEEELRVKHLKDLLTLKAPFEGMGELKTDFGPLFKSLQSQDITDEFVLGIRAAWRKVVDGVARTTPLADAFKHIGEAEWFKAAWQEMRIDLPSNAGDTIMEMINRLLKPFEDKGEAGQLTMPTGGPGFKFQEISTARFMVGGPVAEGLEIQQLSTLKSMDSKLGRLVDIANGKRGPGGELPPMVPVLR